MPFCPNCGTQVNGGFCTSCGRPMSGAPAAAGAPAQAPAPEPGAPKKKSRLLLWVLAGLAGLFILIAVAVVGGGLFLVHKVKQAGLDPDLMRSNPAMAVGKLVTAMNPDLEVLRADEGSGIIEVRDKRTGKTMKMNFEDAKRGKLVFEEDGKGPLTIETDQSGGGGVHLRSADGSLDIGSGAKAPAWIPVYPGSETQGAVAASSAEGERGTVSFLSKDPVGTVIEQYPALLTSSGYKIESQTKLPEGLLLSATNGGRQLTASIGKGSDGTTIAITYGAK